MKRLLKRALLPGIGPRTIPFGLCRGLRLEIDFEHETLFYLGRYELEIARHIRALCRPGMTTYDVGGQHGWYALAFARLGARTTTFEPDPVARKRMRRNIELNPGVTVEVSERFVGTADLRLDSLPAPGLLKVDVDGGELDVLTSAGEGLRETAGVIVETHSPELEQACGQLLRQQGFGVTVVDKRKVLREFRPIAHNRWLVGQRR